MVVDEAFILSGYEAIKLLGYEAIRLLIWPRILHQIPNVVPTPFIAEPMRTFPKRASGIKHQDHMAELTEPVP